MVTTPGKVGLGMPPVPIVIILHFCHKGHYKHACAGGYKILPDRLPEYVVPDLTGFKVSLLLLDSIVGGSKVLQRRQMA